VAVSLHHAVQPSALPPPFLQGGLDVGVAPAVAGAAAGVAGRPLPAALDLAAQVLGMWEVRVREDLWCGTSCTCERLTVPESWASASLGSASR
jgi:hypothetical protein